MRPQWSMARLGSWSGVIHASIGEARLAKGRKRRSWKRSGTARSRARRWLRDRARIRHTPSSAGLKRQIVKRGSASARSSRQSIPGPMLRTASIIGGSGSVDSGAAVRILPRTDRRLPPKVISGRRNDRSGQSYVARLAVRAIGSYSLLPQSSTSASLHSSVRVSRGRYACILFERACIVSRRFE
jgi:hypothetical protein